MCLGLIVWRRLEALVSVVGKGEVVSTLEINLRYDTGG